MAKKKRKRTTRPTSSSSARPGTAVEAPARPAPATARQERKEAARRERERLVRAARRRVFLRRLAKWSVVGVVVVGLAGLVAWRFWQDRQLLARADAAAQAIGCGEIQDLPSEGRAHLAPGEPPPAYGTRPATSGTHSPSTLPPDVSVYDQPVPEPLAVHNLEHAYVFLYYRDGGPDALPQDVVDGLADLARDEGKVILAPHPELDEGTSLALTAWTKLQECPGVSDADQAVLAARGFIQRFRGTDNAPEPAAP